LVTPLSLAAIAAGADGLMIEVHNEPEEALSDGFQSMYLNSMKEFTETIRKQANLSNRTLNLNTLTHTL
jgi:3-deoxy-7-phosphoheptulonate synthase